MSTVSKLSADFNGLRLLSGIKRIKPRVPDSPPLWGAAGTRSFTSYRRKYKNFSVGCRHFIFLNNVSLKIRALLYVLHCGVSFLSCPYFYNLLHIVNENLSVSDVSGVQRFLCRLNDAVYTNL